MLSLDNFYQPEGILSKYLPNYEPRPQQNDFSVHVKQAISTKEHLVIEAGTGVGKSIAYLIPLLLAIAENKNFRVIVSTYTKTLQEQLVKKDLPFLHRIFQDLGLKFQFVCCLGSENYLCRRRWELFLNREMADSSAEQRVVKQIQKWVKQTPTGTITDFTDTVPVRLWYKICRESDFCLSKACTYRPECFYYTAQKQIRQSQVLVCNHHLFFADLASGGRLLPRPDVIVFDEAHNIEAVATSLLSIDISSRRFNRLLESIYSTRYRKHLVAKLTTVPVAWNEEIKELTLQLTDRVTYFFERVVANLKNQSGSLRVRKPNFTEDILSAQILKLSVRLREGIQYAQTLEEETELKVIAQRCETIAEELTSFITQRHPDFVYWIETEFRSHVYRTSLKFAPIEIAEVLNERLFTQYNPIILVSATLTVNNTFQYFCSRIGLSNPRTVALDSPFNFRQHACLYVAADIPDPGDEPVTNYESAVTQRIVELLQVTGGSTFILFTSYQLLDKIYSKLKEEVPELEFIRQDGQTSRYNLLEKFKTQRQTVLMGTDTFWQGVDVPGENLTCVIITRLPFAVPTEPLIEARHEYITQRGGSSFQEYTLPEAVLMFRQGFGRLIRSNQDWGIIVSLDPRLATRTYGQIFIRSLPSLPLTYSLSEIKKFYLQFKQN